MDATQHVKNLVQNMVLRILSFVWTLTTARGTSTAVVCHKTIHVKYLLHGKSYTVVVPRIFGPSLLRTRNLTIFSRVENLDLDVTTIVLQAAGPGCRFHNIATTPKMLGYEMLIFMRKSPTIPLIFETNDRIRF